MLAYLVVYLTDSKQQEVRRLNQKKTYEIWQFKIIYLLLVFMFSQCKYIFTSTSSYVVLHNNTGVLNMIKYEFSWYLYARVKRIPCTICNVLQCILYSIVYTVHYTLYIIHCNRTLYIVCSQSILYCTLYTVHCILYTEHRTLYTVHCTLYTV